MPRDGAILAGGVMRPAQLVVCHATGAAVRTLVAALFFNRE
jgi:hypothetical protein